MSFVLTPEQEAIRETADTTTLVFFTGSERMEYEAGQFLTIRPHQFPALDRFVKFFEDVKGKREPARAYSMCSAPRLSRRWRRIRPRWRSSRPRPTAA